MKKVFFLVNSMDEFNFDTLVKKHLDGCRVKTGTSLPANTEQYDLIILWSHRKIIKNIPSRRNVVLFHSSDLPEGKGWAPIYNAISRGKKYYVVSGIFADKKVDSGDMIVKAVFKIRDDYTADIIRRWDDEISIMLVSKILKRFKDKNIRGLKQIGRGTFYKRRMLEDNKINLNNRLSGIVKHLRACEKRHPAYFYYNRTKYLVRIEPENIPEFPRDLEITFFDTAQ